MIRTVIRPRSRRKVTIHHRVAEDLGASAAPAEPPVTGDPPPPWHGCRIKIEDLPAFKARWGLRTVGGDWPEGEPCPRVYLVEQDPPRTHA